MEGVACISCNTDKKVLTIYED